MPRRRTSRVSISSELSNNSDQSDNLNITEELPDPGLPPTSCKDAKEKKKVSFNFPVEVITQGGKFTGIGTVNLLETLASVEKTTNRRKTKAELKEVLSHFDFQDLTQEEKELVCPQIIDEPKCQEKPLCTNRKSKKETAREAKGAKKKVVAATREAIKKAIDHEKAAKVEIEGRNKVNSRGPATGRYVDEEQLQLAVDDAAKYISIEMHPKLAAAAHMAETVRVLNSLGVRIISADTIRDAGLLVWTRRQPCTLTNDGGQIKLIIRPEVPLALYLMRAESAVSFAGSVAAHVAGMRALAGTASLVLLLYGAADMCKTFPRGSGVRQMTKEKYAKMVAELHLELLVSHHIELVVVESPKELAVRVVQYTRAVTHTSHKKSKYVVDDQADYYMRGENKNCVIVDKYGNGLSRLWEQMIAVLPQSSLEVARTLCEEYKTPSALLQEFQSDGGIAKVANIGVARTNVPGAKTRRIGPEFARKLHTLFTSEDGDALIE